MTLPIGTAEERELIERLGKMLAFDFGDESAHCIDLAETAAAMLTALQSRIAEVERLTKERDHWKAECKALCDVVSEHIRARASLTQGGK